MLSFPSHGLCICIELGYHFNINKGLSSISLNNIHYEIVPLIIGLYVLDLNNDLSITFWFSFVLGWNGLRPFGMINTLRMECAHSPQLVWNESFMT